MEDLLLVAIKCLYKAWLQKAKGQLCMIIDNPRIILKLDHICTCTLVVYSIVVCSNHGRSILPVAL